MLKVITQHCSYKTISKTTTADFKSKTSKRHHPQRSELITMPQENDIPNSNTSRYFIPWNGNLIKLIVLALEYTLTAVPLPTPYT
jgi:hypothetical protein